MYTIGPDDVTMPAGSYWVGDPCYGTPDEHWEDWLRLSDRPDCLNGGLVGLVEGYPVLGVSTAFGDGSYQGSDGNLYPVDAGLIGVVPAEVADFVGDAPFGMTRYMFVAPFRCHYDPQYGTIHIADIEIYTDPPPDEPDYDDPCTCEDCRRERGELDDEYETGEDL